MGSGSHCGTESGGSSRRGGGRLFPSGALALRKRLLEPTNDQELADLAAQVTAAHFGGILRTLRVTPELVISLVRHPDRINTAISLLPCLYEHVLEYVATHWDLHRPGTDELGSVSAISSSLLASSGFGARSHATSLPWLTICVVLEEFLGTAQQGLPYSLR